MADDVARRESNPAAFTVDKNGKNVLENCIEYIVQLKLKFQRFALEANPYELGRNTRCHGCVPLYEAKHCLR